MNKRYLLQMAVWFLFGILFVITHKAMFLVLGLVGAVSLLYGGKTAHRTLSKRFLHGIGLCLFFGLGIFRGLSAVSCMTLSNHQFVPDKTICFTGTLMKKEYKNEHWNYELSRIEFPVEYHMDHWEGALVVTVEEDAYPLGGRYYVEGTVRSFRRGENDGSFDEAEYYLAKMVGAVVKPTEIRLIKPPLFGLGQGLFDLRRDVAAVYAYYLPGEESGILAAMTLGEKKDLSEEAKRLFQDTGISHILAISGLHISLVGMLFFRRLRKRILPLPAAAITFVLVLLYGMLTGNSISTERAVGMFALFLVSCVFGLSYDLLTALAVMSIVLLWQNPYAYRQIGFVFSFGAVLGVVLVANSMGGTYEMLCDYRWRTFHRMDHGKHYRKNAKEILIGNLLSGMGIHMATIPIMAYFFYGFPVYVVGINLLVLPVLGVLITLGLLGGLLGGICGSFFGMLPVWKVFFFPCHVILYFYESLCAHSLSLPAAQWIVGRPKMWQILLYYILLLGVCTFLRKRIRGHLAPLWERARHGSRKRATKWIRIYLVAIAIGCMASLGVLMLPKTGFEIDVLSVGQGDGIYIQSPEGTDFFIDGGSSSKSEVGTYVIEPFLQYHGVREVSYWFITHMDEDHYNGVLEVLEGDVGIRYLVLAKTVEKNEGYDALCRACEAHGVTILYMEAGDVIGTKQMRLECFYPPEKAVYEGTNENSLCLLLSTEDFHGVFTGDLGEEQERYILSRGMGRRLSGMKIDFLKAGHHGSNSSDCAEWLETLQPEVVFISAGKNNSYGHPGKEFLSRLEKQQIPWHCTIDEGQLTLRKNGKRMEIYGFFEGK
ncbi:MAG: DNA internalization-related competence protein ComEC/Rec2 [Lachnospiraceae bacterium]|nr:DNA internalization-related competence protein ComEC/Rec2 [Lachnospiraceae bacterium]